MLRPRISAALCDLRRAVNAKRSDMGCDEEQAAHTGAAQQQAFWFHSHKMHGGTGAGLGDAGRHTITTRPPRSHGEPRLLWYQLPTPPWLRCVGGRVWCGHQLGMVAPPKLLVELTPRSPHRIASSAISPDGTRLAYSIVGGVRVFDVVLQEEGARVRRLSKLPAELAAAQALLFSSDAARLVCLSADGQVQIVDLLDRELLATLTLPALEVPEPRTVPLLAASSDFQWVAVTHDLDVHVFNMDSLRLHCTLPRQPTQHTAMAFVPNSCHLVAALTSREVHIFDVEGGEPTAWSAKNSRSLPAAWLERRDKLVSISFNPSQPSALYLWDAASFGVLFTDRSVKEEEEGVQLEMVKRYQPLIFLDFAGPDAMVVAERPWLSIMQSLPAPLYRAKYGV